MAEEKRAHHIRELGELISGIQVAMLTTLDVHGRFHSRPMWSQHRNFDGSLWFFSRKDSPKINEVQGDNHVTVTYSDIDEGCFVCIYGRGQVVRDKNQAEKLWNEHYRSWFPEGWTDPTLCLIQVKVEKAEYWDSPSGSMRVIEGFGDWEIAS